MRQAALRSDDPLLPVTWHTSFWSLGAQAQVGRLLLAQAMDGSIQVQLGLRLMFQDFRRH